jgi:pimeloyl-ACP methyl ester carboxylesterase
MNGEVAVIDLHHSLPLFMADHAVDFWALDYRTHFIPPATPVADLTELKGWTTELFESDIEAAANFVMRTTGRSQIFVAGFSRGVSFAYLFAARHPHEVEGLVIFDGSIGIGHANATAPPNRYADDVGGAHLTFDKRKALMEAVIANPDGPAPIPKYKTARENLEQVVYGAGESGRRLFRRGGARPDAGQLRSLLADRPGLREFVHAGRSQATRGFEDSRDRLQQHQYRRAMARARRRVSRVNRR